MIELPESYALAEQVKKTLTGKRISNVVANHSPHGFAWFSGDPADYPAKLVGKNVTGAHVWSGNVRIEAEEMRLQISTPMRYHAPGEKRPAKHQLLIQFEDGSAISCTVQMWGCMFCYEVGHESEGIPIACSTNTNPSPLENEFDFPYFCRLAEPGGTNALSAKAFLATEQRIVGLGNGVLQDILWTAKIHPKRVMGTLSDAEFRCMFDAVKTVLRDMAAQGGRDTERDLFGMPGGYRTVMSRKTVGNPCPRCGETIRKEAYLGGSIYYCPGCQGL
jgi:formamidopyrimidine-DNA glycosylase